MMRKFSLPRDRTRSETAPPGVADPGSLAVRTNSKPASNPGLLRASRGQSERIHAAATRLGPPNLYSGIVKPQGYPNTDRTSWLPTITFAIGVVLGLLIGISI